MKIRNLTRLGALALTMTMVTTSLMGGTLAKYTTTISGTDTVTLARFGYEANDGADDIEYTTGTTLSIDLFDDLATDAIGTIQVDSTVNGTDEGMYLAPGAYGSFDIELNGYNSDVDIDMAGSKAVIVIAQKDSSGGDVTAQLADTDEFLSYTITYTDTTTGSDVELYTTNTTGGTASTAVDPYTSGRTTLATLEADLTAVINGVILEKNSVGVIHVDYAWVTYDADVASLDAADTALGQKIAGSDLTDPNGEKNDGTANDDVEDNDVVDTTIVYAAPTITLTITNTASQIVATEGNTVTPVYSEEVSYDSGYTIDGSATQTTKNTD